MNIIKITKFNKNSGFTLIELIISLVIMAILGTLATMWFITIIDGYLVAKKNNTIVQNAQVILTRLAKELSSTRSITSGDQTSLTFLSLSKSIDPGNQSVTLSWNSGTQDLLLGTEVMADEVTSFNLKYYDKYDAAGGTSYLPASTTLIKITFSLTNVGATFEERVFLHRIMSDMKLPNEI
jgi:prepilin-type N-terminal cleavage/methylation domain-containing protein